MTPALARALAQVEALNREVAASKAAEDNDPAVLRKRIAKARAALPFWQASPFGAGRIVAARAEREIEDMERRLAAMAVPMMQAAE